MEKIQQMSKRLRIFFILWFCIIPVLNAVGYAFGDLGPSSGHDPLSSPLLCFAGIDPKVINPELLVVTATTRVLCFLVSMPYWGMHMVGLWYVLRLLKLYRQGSIFEAANVRCIRRVGWALLLAPFLRPLCKSLSASVLMMNTPNKTVRYYIELVPQSFTGVAIGISIILVARIMNEGRKFKEDSTLTI